MSENVITSNFRTLKDDDTSTVFRYPVETIKGDKGEPGKPGDKGEKGSGARISSVEVVSTLAPGEEATVAHETTYNAEADMYETSIALGIPRGEKGEQGDKGETGYTPRVEDVETRTLAPGEEASVVISEGVDNPQDVRVVVSIPEGKQGVQGKQGERGLPAVFEAPVVVETLDPEEDARAEVTLADPASNTWKMSLSIPQGVKGDTPRTPDLEFVSLGFTDDEGGAQAVTSYNATANRYEVKLTLPRVKGEKGEDGATPRFIGKYDSLGDISATPDYANLATITVDGREVLYWYDGAQWQELGTLTGARGEKGDPGEPGDTLKIGDIKVEKVRSEVDPVVRITEEDGAFNFYYALPTVDFGDFTRYESIGLFNELYDIYRITIPEVKEEWYDGAKVEYYAEYDGDGGVIEQPTDTSNWTYNGGRMYINIRGTEYIGGLFAGGSILAENNTKIINLPLAFNAIKVIPNAYLPSDTGKTGDKYLIITFNPTDIKTELLTWGDLSSLTFEILMIKGSSQYLRKTIEYEYLPNEESDEQ